MEKMVLFIHLPGVRAGRVGQVTQWAVNPLSSLYVLHMLLFVCLGSVNQHASFPALDFSTQTTVYALLLLSQWADSRGS